MNTPNAIARLIAEALDAHRADPAAHVAYVTLDSSGAFALPILDTDPAAPTNGGGLVYLFDDGSGVELRIITAAGVITVGP
jgi:hypothetical protein